MSFNWFIWKIVLHFPANRAGFLEGAHLLFVMWRSSGSVIWAFLLVLFLLHQFCLQAFTLIFSRQDKGKCQYCHKQTEDIIMTLTCMINGVVYIFSFIRANQGHLCFVSYLTVLLTHILLQWLKRLKLKGGWQLCAWIAQVLPNVYFWIRKQMFSLLLDCNLIVGHFKLLALFQ